MVIKEFEQVYRDDLIFMVLQAKDALGRKPGLNEDLCPPLCHELRKPFVGSSCPKKKRKRT